MLNQAMFLENLAIKRISLDWNAMSIFFVMPRSTDSNMNTPESTA